MEVAFERWRHRCPWGNRWVSLVDEQKPRGEPGIAVDFLTKTTKKDTYGWSFCLLSDRLAEKDISKLVGGLDDGRKKAGLFGGVGGLVFRGIKKGFGG